MARIHTIILSILFLLFSRGALADFPLPNKTAPFTEGGTYYPYEFEYLSNTGTYYVIYCPNSPPWWYGLALTYQSGYKIVPYPWGCQEYKYNGSAWVSTTDNYYYTYLYPWYCLGDIIRTNGDLYWNFSMPSTNLDPYYCNLGTLTPYGVVFAKNWDFESDCPIVETHLSFPLAGYTPYTVPISAVMDHLRTGRPL